MKNSSKIKLILLIFFIIFFGLLFWYFYEPSSNNVDIEKEGNDNSFSLFPFGKGNDPVEKVPDVKINNNNFSRRLAVEELPKLRQISKIPTAGVVIDPLSKKELHKINVDNDIFNTDKAWKYQDRISSIRYIAKKNGNIYSTYTNTSQEKRVSNITIPKVYDAEFWDKNNLVIRYLDREKNIKTYSIELKEKSIEEKEEEKKKNGSATDFLKLEGRFLPMNILEFSLLPNSLKLFYLKNDSLGNTTGIITNNRGDVKEKIFSSGLHEWNIYWKNSKYILINSKASSDTYTLSFQLNATNGLLEKVNSALLAGNGLPNYSFTKILFSGQDYEKKYYLYIYDVKTHLVKKLDEVTLTEKCVWSKNNVDVYCAVPNGGLSSQQPDAWYKGYTDFSDSIYKINTKNNESEVIFDSYYEGKNFDISKIYLDPYEDYVYFIDSMTDFAWSYKLPEKKNDIVVLDEKFTGVLGGGNVCPTELTLTENLKAGDRNGKYSKWARKKITEAKILQKQMNRLGFNAGEVDGILGRNTDASIKRMQKYLGTYQDGLVGPITRSLLNNSCD